MSNPAREHFAAALAASLPRPRIRRPHTVRVTLSEEERELLRRVAHERGLTTLAAARELLLVALRLADFEEAAP